MIFSWIDITMFLAFVTAVVTIGIYKSRQEKTSEDYFLAGRGLMWWLIGFSLIAANISTEQFVGMSGNAASHVGLAIASYEWMAAITLVVVAFGFLPYFLRAGIFTMPEFLEVRYNGTARTIMAVATLFIYMLLLGSVTYSGALTIRTLGGQMGYNVSLASGSLVIGLIAMVYVAAGGLKACAWADLIQGSALIIGGALIMVFAFIKLGKAPEAASIINVQTGEVAIKTFASNTGAIQRFWELNSVRMNMFLPKTDNVLPWTALLLGLWIPNFYYWGLNQYITQRTLGSSSLAQGQRGIVFASFLKLVIPFVIVIPGIIAFNLFSKDMLLEAIKDNAIVMTKYEKANPNTGQVIKLVAPADSMVANWTPGRFLLAVYPDDAVPKSVNPFVLPISQTVYDETKAGEYPKFISEDKSWRSAYTALAQEVDIYNKNVENNAAAAGARMSNEKFIAYKYDTAMGMLLGKVLPQGVGVVGFVLAALLGAVVSSLAAMLNASSTILTMDVVKKYFAPNASQKATVLTGRICVVGFSLIAVFLAPQLGNPKISNSIFTIIQEGQGFISPGILAVFVFGLVIRKAPPVAGVVGLLTNIAAYGIMKWTLPNIQFLNRMAICFGLCLAVMAIITLVNPLEKPVEFQHKTKIDLTSSKGAKIAGFVVVGITIIFYIIFSPLGVAK
ncbi:sodium/solute symporter [candidate division KSB1 bacterium]|nr:sodium/solute symporter [candidate division KSB1 bacterium]